MTRKDYTLAVKYMYEDNALPGICGTICTHKCEDDCVYNHRGDAVQIMSLKRFATDQLRNLSNADPAKTLSDRAQSHDHWLGA